MTIELYGTLTVRLLCYLIPSLLAVVFDSALPHLSRKIKADGKDHLPHRLGREKVLRIVAVATGNVVLGVLVQAALELITTRVFLLRIPSSKSAEGQQNCKHTLVLEGCFPI